jgi:regulatory protein
VRQRLVEHGHSPPAIDAAVDRVVQGGLVDDAEFARYWVEQRQAFHPRGPRALHAELRRKGVDRETAEAAVGTTADDQVEAAYRAAYRRAATLSTASERAFSQTLSAFLLRRGFDYEAVRATTRRLWEERTGVDGDEAVDIA